MRLLKESIEERNAAIGNGPKFVLKGTSTVELGNAALYLKFDQQYSNPDQYVLDLGIGLAPSKHHQMFGPGPTPERHVLQVTSTEDLSRVLWKFVGSQDRATSAWLVEFALDQLDAYARKHNLK